MEHHDTRRAALRGGGLIFLAALLTHVHVLWGGWVRDDYALILGAPAVQDLASIPAQLTQSFLGIFWRPSVTVLYTLEHAVWGLRPAGFHATNIALHCAAAVLVAAVWRRLTDRTHVPLLAGLLFAVHGAHYQPAVIADRTGLMATTGCLLAWWCAMRAGGGLGGWRALLWNGGAVAAYVVALGAKEEAVVLPVIMLVVGVLQPWPIDGPAHWKRLAPMATLMLFVAGGYMVVRSRILGGDGLVATMLPGLSQRAISMPAWMLHHWRDAVVPLWLDLDYRGLVWPRMSTAWVAVCGAGVVACIGLAWRVRRTHGEVLLGLVWAMLAWLPASNLIPVYPETATAHVFMPAHFLYFSNVALVGVMATVGVALVERRRRFGTAVLAGFLLMHAVTAVRMNYVWMDDARMYRYVLRMHPRHPLMWRNLGLALANRGRFADAAQAYEHSLDAQPSAEAHLGLGAVQQELGAFADAARAFDACLALEPTRVECYMALARLHATQGEWAAAFTALDRGAAAGADGVRLDAERVRLDAQRRSGEGG